MLQILRYSELMQRRTLAKTMFQDRASQFVLRLRWDVGLTAEGLEVDQFDDDDAIYLVAHDGMDRHMASMRLRPTTGRTMLKEVFASRFDLPNAGPSLWESTRFCVSPLDRGEGAMQVLLAGQGFGLAQGLDASLGVVYKHTLRIYRKLGWVPEVLQHADDPTGPIVLGAWRFSPEILANLTARSKIGHRMVSHWVNRAKGHKRVFN